MKKVSISEYAVSRYAHGRPAFIGGQANHIEMNVLGRPTDQATDECLNATRQRAERIGRIEYANFDRCVRL